MGATSSSQACIYLNLNRRRLTLRQWWLRLSSGDLCCLKPSFAPAPRRPKPLISMLMKQLKERGYEIVPGVLSLDLVEELLGYIQRNPHNDGFGVRNFLPNNPEVVQVLQNAPELTALLKEQLAEATCVRSIYFDKPPKANWVVGWHQDLTMNLNSIPEGKDWKNTRSVSGRVVSQPGMEVLQAMITIRIHLDDTDGTNGALRVLPGSHRRGVIRNYSPSPEQIRKRTIECHVPRGGLMLMKPLTLHASRRTVNTNASRRVIHLEFLEAKLVENIDLREKTLFV